jgi:hypothetical protein
MTFRPALLVLGIDQALAEVRALLVTDDSIAHTWAGRVTASTLRANRLTGCRDIPPPDFPDVRCFQPLELIAEPESEIVTIVLRSAGITITLDMRRVDPGQAEGLDERLREVTSEESEEEIARAEEDAREELELLALETAPVPQGPGPALETLDEIVAEGERERQRRAQVPRRIAAADAVSVTRNSTRTGTASVRVRVVPWTPQPDILLRASDARQLADGENQRLELQRDRLTTDSGMRIRSVTLEFTAGTDEADGLPALIPINARTSLFNFDYARLRDSTQPLMATLRNVMDPETRRCVSTLRLGVGAEDFHNRFVLVGNGLGNCNRTVNSREGGLVFADTVPQRLRQELRELYDPVDKRLARNLEREPGIVFVIWRPESPRDDFRFVRSLSRTNVLLFNGPSWEQGLTAQQRKALGEEVGQE